MSPKPAYAPFEDGIEVNGQTVLSVVEGFAVFKKIPSDILLSVGIGQRGADGYVALARDAWVSQAAWLEGFSRIASAVGTAALYSIGLKIPACAIFPGWVKEIHSACRSIDIAYHLNHRKKGRVMFDEATGVMLEGIGHYGCEPHHGHNLIHCRCENPYPCDFDKGIVTAMAQRFQPTAWVDHLDGSCRKSGNDHCTYSVSWT